MMGVFVQVNEDTRYRRLFPMGYVIEENGCWRWVGSYSVSGYGVWHRGRAGRQAHRAIYELRYGPIADGLELDHLCRNPACVNPDHLEPVTGRVNNLRSNSWAGVHARQTHCIRGHAFDDANTYIEEHDGGLKRRCRACRREYMARYHREVTKPRRAA